MGAVLAYIGIPTPQHSSMLFPLATLLGAFAAAILLPRLVDRWRGHPRRSIEGVCGTCGYSLQGLPTPVCPECGSDTRFSRHRLGHVNPYVSAATASAFWMLAVLLLNHHWADLIDRWLFRVVFGIEWF